MYKKIMVAVDGSEASTKAVKHAVKLQNLCDSELIILTVFRHQSLLEGSLSMIKVDEPQNVVDDVMRDHAKEIVEAAKAQATDCGSNNLRGFVKRGPPARTIVGFGEEHDVDLIVIGARGTGDIENFLLGSVSHKVTSLAKMPVLVV